MLPLKYLFEDYDLAREVLSRYAHDWAKTEEVIRYFRISSNAIYPYRDGEKLCFLRLAPVGEKLERNVKGELALLRYLEREDFPALRIVPTLDGDDVFTLERGGERYYVSAFEGVAGKPIEDTDFSEPVLFAYGKTLGRFHRLSERYVTDEPKWSYEDALDWTEGILAAEKAPERMRRELAETRARLAELPKTNFGLVHYDFEVDNVFYDEERKRCSVIDFDDSMLHFYDVDIEQALDSMREEMGESAYPAGKAAFLSGYRSERATDDNLEDRCALMRRFCDLYAYARILRSMSDKPEREPDWMLALEEKLSGRLRRIEAAVREREE